MAWPPIRRHLTDGPSGVTTHSQVARPSGPVNDHVISQTPGAERSGRTRSDAGQPDAPFDDCQASQASWNARTVLRKVSRSAGFRRR